jgi:TM2 domain
MVDEASGTNAAAESTAGKPVADVSTQIVYCARCGGVMSATDRFCHACGWEVGSSEAPRIPAPAVVNPSDRNRLTALLLCVFLGPFGAHRFYVGKVGTGLIWLFTLGFLGVGVVYDLIFIATGEFRDDRERRVVRWD